jgi:hypothetical protein
MPKKEKIENKPIKIDSDLIERLKKNGTFFKKEGKSESSPKQSKPSKDASRSKSTDSTRKTEARKEESPVSKGVDAKKKIDKRDSSFEEHVAFHVDFEPTSVSSPVIRERPKEQPVKDMEQFLETVPTPTKKEEKIIYEPIDENYLRSYESTYQGRKWDEERVVHEIKENLQRFDHPGRFREIMPIQDPAITKHVFSEQVKYDLEMIDRLDNERGIFRPVFEKKYKSRGKL